MTQARGTRRHARRATNRRAGLGDWFVRRSPADTAGVLSPRATIVLVLALMIVVAMCTRSVRASAAVPTAAPPATASAAEGAPGESDPGTRGTTAAVPPDDAAAAPEQRPPPSAPVTLAFGGDVHFEGRLGAAVRDDPGGALRPLAALFADADLAVVNLETAITDRGTPAPKTHTFRGPREGLTALAAAGVDVVSIANNHGMDYGIEGLADTHSAARAAGLALVGGGRDATEAYRPHVVEVHGRRIAVLGATQVLDGNLLSAWTASPGSPGLASAKPQHDGLPRLLGAVRAATAEADTVVVMLHWGREREQCSLPHQEDLAVQLRAAGADVIVGGHAHRLAAGGHLGDAVVHYGLGNLVFYAERGPATASGAFTVTIAPDGAPSTSWRPARLRRGVATAIGDREARAQARDDWHALRSCAAVTAAAPAR